MKHAGAIAHAFAQTSARNEAALIAYCTAGFPDLARSMELVRSCAEHGADIIEVGVPFSDPVADGHSIQFASHEALEHGVTLRAIMRALGDLDLHTPVVIMSYLNPLLSFGWDRFLDRAGYSRIAGMIIPDLPVEEAAQRSIQAHERGVDLVLLAAPTSTAERLQRIIEVSQGFVYCVGATGTTGVRTSLAQGTAAFVERVREVADIPCAVGFGISRSEHIHALRDHADGVVVGSRIIEAIRNEEDISDLIQSMKKATRR